MPFEPSAYVVRKPGIASTAVDQDLVLLNLARNNYIGLDKIGRRIWELLAERKRIADLCGQLADEFDGPSEIITQDALSFLAELESEGLVQLADEPAQ